MRGDKYSGVLITGGGEAGLPGVQLALQESDFLVGAAPGGVGNVSDSAMAKDFLWSAGGKRNGTANCQAEAFRRRTFREIE